MIFQILIRSPDLEHPTPLVLGMTLTQKQCEEFCINLLEELVPKKLASMGFKVFPAGFVIEGVGYGNEEDDDFLDSYDLFIKVLH